jgi:hypothetical protein
VRQTPETIADFRCKVNEIFNVLGYYAAYSGNSLLELQLEQGTGRLSRNVDKELPLHAT